MLNSRDSIQKDKEEENKDWLYGLGIGLSAASIAGKELSNNDQEDNSEQEFQL